MWVLGAEVQTLETRTSGMSAVVASNYLLSFAIGQGFLSMLCGMKWGACRVCRAGGGAGGGGQC